MYTYRVWSVVNLYFQFLFEVLDRLKQFSEVALPESTAPGSFELLLRAIRRVLAAYSLDDLKEEGWAISNRLSEDL